MGRRLERRATPVVDDAKPAAGAGVDQPMFRALAETTPAAVFVQRGARLLYVNRAAEVLTGYSREELLANDAWLLLPGDERERARSVYDSRIRDLAVDVPPRREQRLLTKSGEIRWVEVSIARIDWDDTAALIGTAIDVSDRRSAEGARRRSDRRFRALIEHTSDVIFIFDANALMSYVGPSIEGILGHPPTSLEGRDMFELLHPDDLDLCRSAVATLLSAPGKTTRIQYRVRHADGSWRWMEGIGTNLLDEPAIGGVVVNARDVTDWRAAEDQLCESEARFALAIDGATDGIWDWNVATGELFASPRMREMLGVSADAPIAVPTLFTERVHPDDFPRVQEHWQSHLVDASSHYEAEYRYRMPDGRYRWLLVRARTVRDQGGAPQRMIGSLTDTTARKTAEEEARNRQAELAHVLRVGAMNEMAASIAHELNQPLAAIVNYARGCARRLAQQGVGADVLDALDHIAGEALRAGDVVHSLKRVVRKEPPRESLVDLAALVSETVQLVRSEATERGIGIRVATREGVGAARGDRVQLQQVLLNLLRNAIESIALRPGLIEVRGEPAGGGMVRLSVSDSGIGVPPTVLDQIFSPFFTTKDSGLGMGLSISRTIVEAHGGRLWAEARAGSGTTFSFTVPTADPFG